MSAKLELISFKLCPFVQRAIVTLNEKGIDFDINYIDVYNPPEWFKEISPLGQVPILRVGDEVLFESSVIQEYVDEATAPSMHPSDILTKAQNRAWMSFGGDINGLMYQINQAKDKDAFNEKLADIKAKLAKLEAVHSGKDFFNGTKFNLIDAAFAPLFMRLQLLSELCGLSFFEGLPNMQIWSNALNAKDSVKNSVVPEFPKMFKGMLMHFDGHIATLLSK